MRIYGCEFEGSLYERTVHYKKECKYYHMKGILDDMKNEIANQRIINIETNKKLADSQAEYEQMAAAYKTLYAEYQRILKQQEHILKTKTLNIHRKKQESKNQLTNPPTPRKQQSTELEEDEETFIEQGMRTPRSMSAASSIERLVKEKQKANHMVEQDIAKRMANPSTTRSSSSINLLSTIRKQIPPPRSVSTLQKPSTASSGRRKRRPIKKQNTIRSPKRRMKTQKIQVLFKHNEDYGEAVGSDGKMYPGIKQIERATSPPTTMPTVASIDEKLSFQPIEVPKPYRFRGQFDRQSTHPHYIILNGGSSLRGDPLSKNKQSSQKKPAYQTACCKHIFTGSGIHSWIIHIDKLLHTDNLFIGCARPTIPFDECCGKSTNSWALKTTTGEVMTANTLKPYFNAAKKPIGSSQDIICVLDLTSGTLSYGIHEKDCGVAFENLTPPLIFCVSSTIGVQFQISIV